MGCAVPARPRLVANPVLWFDVMGKDGKSLGSFYSQLFGWEFKQEDTEGIAYGVLSLGEDGGVGGVVTTSPDDGNGFATFYAEVDDISATLAKGSTTASAWSSVRGCACSPSTRLIMTAVNSRPTTSALQRRCSHRR